MDDFDMLMSSLCRLPSIGKKSATRMAYYLLRNKEMSKDIFKTIINSLENIKTCSICGNYSSFDPCEICDNPKRDKSILCIIEEPSDLLAIEDTGYYKGQYHILMGALNPLEGKGPEKLRINELLKRLNENNFSEVLIATNPTIDGESTFLYLQNLLQAHNLKISKIATGIPMGGSLEYTDKFTLSKALLSKHYL